MYQQTEVEGKCVCYFFKERKESFGRTGSWTLKSCLFLSLCVIRAHSSSTSLVLAFIYPSFVTNMMKNFHTWPEYMFHSLAAAETFEEHQSHRGILHSHEEWLCALQMDIGKASFRGSDGKMLLLIPDSVSNCTTSYLHLQCRKSRQGGVASKFLWYVTLPIILDVLGSLVNLGLSTGITMAIKNFLGKGRVQNALFILLNVSATLDTEVLLRHLNNSRGWVILQRFLLFLTHPLMDTFESPLKGLPFLLSMKIHSVPTSLVYL